VAAGAFPDGGWVVNGAKTFITNGVRAVFYVTGGDAVREVSMAKLLSQRACVEVYEDAWRLSDGDAELERGLRDARLGPIGGGTDEIMREIVGRGLGL
jgi:acyl-CoA dehydrogenase